jgi:L-alanine-DL-glutamate epimerase-like enolase superfamily enzyme
MARNLIELGGVGFIQIDTGRIGGITSAVEVAAHARAANVTFVNHTFTTQLALSASLQPYADAPSGAIAEYPVEASSLARGLTKEAILPSPDGLVRLPEGPGLGLTIDHATVRAHLVDVAIEVAGKLAYRTPDL